MQDFYNKAAEWATHHAQKTENSCTTKKSQQFKKARRFYVEWPIKFNEEIIFVDEWLPHGSAGREFKLENEPGQHW